MKGSWRAAEALGGQERPLMIGAASVTVEGPELRGHAKKLWLGTMKRAYERLLVTVQPGYSRDPSISEMPASWDAHHDQQQRWSGASQSLEDRLCVLQRAELEK